jgi:hypothetical protein
VADFIGVQRHGQRTNVNGPSANGHPGFYEDHPIALMVNAASAKPSEKSPASGNRSYLDSPPENISSILKNPVHPFDRPIGNVSAQLTGRWQLDGWADL